MKRAVGIFTPAEVGAGKRYFGKVVQFFGISCSYAESI
jgi:hypothetical protein